MLEGKVVIVTGGGGLLGREFCRNIAVSGGTAVIASRNVKAAEEIAGGLRDSTERGSIACERLDITEPDSVSALFERVGEKFSRIHALVNNALPKGRNYGRKFEDVEYPDFCESINAHLGGYFLMCQQAVKFFSRQGHGNIVNIASIYGTVAPRFALYEGTAMTKEVEYALSKAAIIHLTQYLASYCKGRNIRVNSLSPGGVLDGQPGEFVDRYNGNCLTKGMLDPQDIAPTLTFLLADQSRHLNGHNIVVDDGFVLGGSGTGSLTS